MIPPTSDLPPAGGSGFEIRRLDPISGLELPAKLYGREEDTAALKWFVRRAQRGRPAMLLVTGSPGVGKTAFFLDLLHDIVRRRRTADSPAASSINFEGQYHMRRCCTGVPGPHPPDPDAAGSRSGGLGNKAAGCQRRQRPRHSRRGPGSRRLINSLQPPVVVLSPVDARHRFDRVFADVVRSLATGMMPLCLFMDDLQWADAASLELLTRTLSRAETGPLMFVAACREGEADPGTPLAAALEALEKAGTPCERLDLEGSGSRPGAGVPGGYRYASAQTTISPYSPNSCIPAPRVTPCI